MPLSAYALASGSSGNAILVRNDRAALLIDAGIGIRRLTSAIEQTGTSLSDLSAILITHEHDDHVAGAIRMARRFRIPLISNSATLASIPGAGSVPSRTLEIGEELALGPMCVRSFPVSHDAACPVGYTIACGGAAICVATDTGILTPQIRAEAEKADLLILESNHDLEMLLSGPYPWYLKRRIMGDRGHLSNEAAGDLLLELADSGRTLFVWLAHLSAANNSPSVALAAARKTLSTCPGSKLKVGVALRDVPSLRWCGGEDHPG